MSEGSVSESSTQDGEMEREARAFVDEVREALNHSPDVPEDVRGEIERRLNELSHRIEDGDREAVEDLLESTREFIDEHAELRPKSALREYAESIGMAVLFALMLRGFVIEPFKIPTGSMVPTLEVGDHLFVNKFLYGIRVPFTETYLTRFSEPEPGEIVVFTFPSQEAQDYIAKQPPARRECIDQGSLAEEKDFIKRVVGVEGDRVAIEENTLKLNGEPVSREFLKKKPTGEFLRPHEVHERERIGGEEYTIKHTDTDRKFGPIEVRDDHVFVMGDNRNNSADSRCWGQVPVENIKGRAMFIWWSISNDPDLPWWNRIRWDRIGEPVH